MSARWDWFIFGFICGGIVTFGLITVFANLH
jgi:hypothetical protein